MSTWIQSVLNAADTPVRRSHIPFWILTGLAILALSVLFNDFGLLHFELQRYMPYHLGPGSVWKKIFDNNMLDPGTYQGRELSYLIDHLDAMGVLLSVKWGFPVFVSATHVVLSVSIGVCIAFFAARELKLGPLIGLLLALLFWTTPSTYLHFVFRSGKILAATGLVFLLTEIFRAYAREVDRQSRWVPGRYLFSVLVSAWLLGFSDRQGFFLLILISSCMAVQWVVGRDRLAGRILLLLAVVISIELIYFRWIAPALTRMFFGYDPDFSFNKLPLHELFSNLPHFLGQSIRLLADEFGYIFGHLSGWGVALLAGLGFGVAWIHDQKHRVTVLRSLTAMLVCTFLALWLLYTLMILRHPPLLWPDIRLCYYWSPTVALMVLVFAFVIAGGLRDHPRWKAGAGGGLLLLLIGNIAALPADRDIIVNGHMRDSIALTAKIREALALPPDVASIQFPQTSRMPIYQALVGGVSDSLPGSTNPREFDRWLFQARTKALGAPVPFVSRFGGNVDARYLTSSARFYELSKGGGFMGTDESRLDMRVNFPSSRMRGYAVVQRKGDNHSTALTVNFSINAQPSRSVSYERWSARVELPPGEGEVAVPYSIDCSQLPVNFSLEIPREFLGQVIAGWRNPEVTDVTRDSSSPAWFFPSSGSSATLDELAFMRLLPNQWRPLEAFLRGGRVTEAGIELFAGGELWLKVDGLVTKFSGLAEPAPSETSPLVTPPWVLWYKSGRMQSYTPPSPTDGGSQSFPFQAWCAEPGGWMVIALDCAPEISPVIVRVTEVELDSSHSRLASGQ